MLHSQPQASEGLGPEAIISREAFLQKSVESAAARVQADFGGLRAETRVPLKGSFKGYYRGTIRVQRA